jgi:hypothetical protein
MVRLSFASLIALALVPACGDDGSGPSDSNALLADLPGLRLSGEIGRHLVGSTIETELHLALVYDSLAFQVTHDGDCARLDESLRITWNGTTSEVADRGSVYHAGAECDGPSIAAKVPGAAPTELAIGDDSGALTARFEDPLVGRSASLRAGPAELKAGDAITLALTHPDDFSGAVLKATVDELNGTPLAVTVADGAVTLTMPTPLPFSGNGVVVATLGAKEAPVLSCPTGAACQLYVGVDHRTTVRLVP